MISQTEIHVCPYLIDGDGLHEHSGLDIQAPGNGAEHMPEA